jgi:hypothetical protein
LAVLACQPATPENLVARTLITYRWHRWSKIGYART